MKTTESRYAVLSDAHFGTPESSINDPRVLEKLTEYLVSRGPWEQVIFTGDLLDINLSTFTRSIEGGNYKDLSRPLVGFRQFLDRLHRKSPHGLPSLSRRWVYIPGNHDYKIWDMLSTRVACEEVLSSGHPMGTVPTPLREYVWNGSESFFAGLFKTFGAEESVTVTYPNHVVTLRAGTESIVFTHGHYLDSSQTRGTDLSDMLEGADPSEVARRSRAFIIETAQYQALANAVSFTKGFRRVVNNIVGPHGLANQFQRLITHVGAWLLRLVFRPERVAGRPLSARQLRNIEAYLSHFCGSVPNPRWFVFGHTHHQQAGCTPLLGVNVYNVGSFYAENGFPVTFLEVVVRDAVPTVTMMCVDSTMKVRPVT